MGYNKNKSTGERSQLFRIIKKVKDGMLEKNDDHG